jgi:vacuolar-type H+-ATPase subunit I/STV1
MAIEKLHLLRFVIPKKEVIRFRNTLYKKGVMHLKNVSPLSQSYLPDNKEINEINQNIEKADYAIKVLEEINPEKKPFINNFIPKRPIFTTAEMDKIEKEIVFNDLHSEIFSIAETKKKAQKELKYKQLLLEDLIPFKPFKFSFSDISKYERTSVYFLKADGRSINDLEQFTFLKKNAVIIPVYGEDHKKKIAEGFIVTFPTKILSEAILYLRRAGLKEFTFKDLTKSPIETIEILEKEISSLEKNITKWDSILLDYSKQCKHFYLWKDFLTNKHDRANGVRSFADAKRVTYIEGYIPANQSDDLIQEIASEYLNIYIDKIENGEDPPVKFKNNKWVQPFEFLVKISFSW